MLFRSSFFLALFGGAMALLGPAAAFSQPGALVSLDGDTLEAIGAGACEPLRVDATLQNVGAEPIALGKPEPSCGCSHVEVTPRELAAGETALLEVVINPPNKDTTELHESVTIPYGANESLSLGLVGALEPCALIEVAPLDFGDLNREDGQSVGQAVEMRVFDGGSDAEFTVEPSSPEILAQFDEKLSLNVIISTGMQLGLRSEKLFIRVNGHDFEEIPIGWTTKSLVLQPERVPINFGRVKASEPETMSVAMGLAEGYEIVTVESSRSDFLVKNAAAVASGEPLIIEAAPKLDDGEPGIIEGTIEVEVGFVEPNRGNHLIFSIPFKCLAIP